MEFYILAILVGPLVMALLSCFLERAFARRRELVWFEHGGKRRNRPFEAGSWRLHG